MIRILRATPCAIFPLLPTSLRDNFHYSPIQCYEKSEQRAAQTELLSFRGHLQDVSHARVGCQTPLFFSHIQEPTIHTVAHPVHLFHCSPILITGNSVIMNPIDDLIVVFTASCKEVDIMSFCRKSFREFRYIGAIPPTHIEYKLSQLNIPIRIFFIDLFTPFCQNESKGTVFVRLNSYKKINKKSKEKFEKSQQFAGY